MVHVPQSTSVDNLALFGHSTGRSSGDTQKPRSSTPLYSNRRPQSAQVDQRSQLSELSDLNSPRSGRVSRIDTTYEDENFHEHGQQEPSKLLYSYDHCQTNQPRSPRTPKNNAPTARQFDSSAFYESHQQEPKDRITGVRRLRQDNDTHYSKLESQTLDDTYSSKNGVNAARKGMSPGLRESGLFNGETLTDLDPKDLSFSYKGPPSARREQKTTDIW